MITVAFDVINIVHPSHVLNNFPLRKVERILRGWNCCRHPIAINKVAARLVYSGITYDERND